MQCPDHQLAVSCLIDGELANAEVAPTLDHLLQCRACRGFYEQARALESRLSGLGDEVTADGRRRLPGWIWSGAVAAAIGALGFGLVGDRAAWPTPSGSSERVIDATARRDMSDARFVDLTVELLQADPRYHREMMDVLLQAHAHEDLDAGSWSSRLARADIRQTTDFDEDRDPPVH